MKMNGWLILGLMAATPAGVPTSASALPPTPAATPSAAAGAPVKKATVKHHRKMADPKPKTVKKTAPSAPIFFSESPVALQPGTAEVAGDNLNVRGQAGFRGEVITHLQKGDTVTVLSEITLAKHKAGEPAQWAKIALPANTPVWVYSSFIDPAAKTVKPDKLNVRAGPSEDYSVIGVIESGASVTETGTQGKWIKIEAPSNAFAYVAAMYLKQESSGTVPTNIPPSSEVAIAPEPKPEAAPTTITNKPAQIIPAPQPPTNSVSPEPMPEPAPASVKTNVIIPIVTTVDTNVPPPPRIVTHEGYVRYSVSPVAPTYYELYDPNSNVAVDYLRSSTTNLDLSHYNGFHIVVTGKEGLDARWKNTPVLTIQRIYVLSTNPPATPVYRSPRASANH